MKKILPLALAGLLVSCSTSTKNENASFVVKIPNNELGIEQTIELNVGEKTASYLKKQARHGAKQNLFPFPMSFTPPNATFVLGDKTYYWHGTEHLMGEEIFSVNKELFNVHSYKKSERFPAIRRYMKDIHRGERAAYYKKYPPKREVLQKEYQELLDHIESQL